MDSLLRWSIEQSTRGENAQQAPPPQPRQDLDPGIIDAILGKPDSVLMKEALAVAVDETKEEDERIQALDDFEMLIEQIDNANNIEKLKMWETLHGLLTSPSSTDDIKMQTLWIIGTAVQNNPSAQAPYLSLSPMPTLLSFFEPTVKSGKVRAKAIYALSGLLKHNAIAVRQFEQAGGWKVLKAALEDSDIVVRRKTAFLLNTLILPTTLPVSRPSQSLAFSSPQSNSSSSSNTGITLHTSASQPSGGNEPVHPNSHSAMQSNPSAFSTSEAAVKAFEEQGLLQVLVSAMTAPTPYGPDGESEGDVDFNEKVMRSLHTYATSCDGHFPDGQKRDLHVYIEEETAKAGDEHKAAEQWGMTTDELRALKRATAIQDA